MARLGKRAAEQASAEATLAAISKWADREIVKATAPLAGGARMAGYLQAVKDVREMLGSKDGDAP